MIPAYRISQHVLAFVAAMLVWTGALAAAAPVLDLEAGRGEIITLDANAEAVYVADSAIADVTLRSPKLLFLFGKASGETTFTVIGKNDTVLYTRVVRVAYDHDHLMELVDRLHPLSQISLNTIRQSLIVSGFAPSSEAASEIIQLARSIVGEDGRVVNRLQVSAPNQVNLRVRIAEIGRETTKQLGFSWDILRSAGNLTLGLTTGSFISGLAVTGAGLGLGYDAGSFDVNGLVDALDEQGLISVLAEPNLIALSGETAEFLAGGEFPIPVAQEDNTLSIVFKKFGVALNFVPVVLADGMLHIKVQTEVSQLSDAGAIEANGFRIPALTVRQATTTVNLNSGQSFAIAGLLQNTTNQGDSGTAGLKDIPVLGPLFRSSSFQREETELVVIVTPYLVRPSSTPLALPTDGFRPASDGARIAQGATYVTQTPSDRAVPVNPDGSQGLSGSGGFILR